MYFCPSCHQKTIPFLRKWLSSASLPARCSNCEQECAILISNSADFVVMAAVLITLGGFAAVGLQSFWPLATGLTSAMGYYFWRQHTALLALVTAEEKRIARRSVAMEWLAVLLFSWFN